jgi:hypothetical protein
VNTARVSFWRESSGGLGFVTSPPAHALSRRRCRRVH